jgi:toxin CcdB
VVGLRAGSAVDLAVVMQDDQLSDLATRVVAPLIAIHDRDVERATIAVHVEGVRYVVAVHLLTTVPARNLGRAIANLGAHERALKNAIDLVFFGI